MVLAGEFSRWEMVVVCQVGETSLRQGVTPDRLRGRVNATTWFLTYGAITLGSLLGGALGELVGVRATLVIGMLGILTASLWLVLSPVRTLKEQPDQSSMRIAP